MNKEMLDILNDLSKKTTTELSLQIMELSSENLILEQQCKKQKEVIDKAIELLGNYKHYSTPDEKQNGDNEDLVNNAFDTLKEVSK